MSLPFYHRCYYLLFLGNFVWKLLTERDETFVNISMCWKKTKCQKLCQSKKLVWHSLIIPIGPKNLFQGRFSVGQFGPVKTIQTTSSVCLHSFPPARWPAALSGDSASSSRRVWASCSLKTILIYFLLLRKAFPSFCSLLTFSLPPSSESGGT